MSNLFTMLPFLVSNPTLPVIPSMDFERLSELEAGAYEHWIFDNGAASLSGGVNGRILTAQSDPATFSDSYLSISGNEGKALLTDMGEVAGQKDTICVVFRYSTVTGITIPFGALARSAEAALGGGCPYILNESRGLFLQYRGSNVASVDTGYDAPANTWHFLAVSRDMASGGAVRTLLSGHPQHSVTVSNVGAYVPAVSGRKIGLGAAYYNSAIGSTLDFAEAVVFDRALSASDLADVYARAKARMAKRGITVV